MLFWLPLSFVVHETVFSTETNFGESFFQVGYMVKVVCLSDLKFTLGGNHISGLPYVETSTRDPNKMQNLAHDPLCLPLYNVPFGVTYEKIGTIQRRLAWPLHKDDTLSRSGRSTDLNIYFYPSLQFFLTSINLTHLRPSSQYKWFAVQKSTLCMLLQLYLFKSIQKMPGIWFMFTKHPDEKQDGT